MTPRQPLAICTCGEPFSLISHDYAEDHIVMAYRCEACGAVQPIGNVPYDSAASAAATSAQSSEAAA